MAAALQRLLGPSGALWLVLISTTTSCAGDPPNGSANDSQQRTQRSVLRACGHLPPIKRGGSHETLGAVMRLPFMGTGPKPLRTPVFAHSQHWPD